MQIDKKKSHVRTQTLASLIVPLCILLTGLPAYAQTAVMKVNKVYCGIIENGGVGAFNYGSSFFPADYNAMGPSMEEGSGVTGSTIIMATTNWTDPKGTLIPKAAIQPVDVYSAWGVVSPLESYTRYGYPSNTVNFQDVTLPNFATVDGSKMVGTSDQTAYVTTQNVLGVEVKRSIFAWSQQFHDNYIVVDLVLTNNSGATLTDFYFSVAQSPFYWRLAKGGNPSIPSQDQFNRAAAWHNYYGARPGDSLRVWYMVPADDPDRPGDQMGGPVASQDGRLASSDIPWYTILHASQSPYSNPANDIDDPLQPRVTDVYAPNPMGTQGLWGGTDASGRTLIYDLMAGKNGMDQPMAGQIAGTFHRANNDEQNDPDWSNLGVGFSKASVFNSSISSFGPYNFQSGQSIHVVYAGGYTGLGIEKEKELGEQWLNSTITNPPGLPNAATGYFPDSFAFPLDATEKDKIKDRWISTGIDSVHQSASRAKWNFNHDWQVPGSPPPPTQEITGFGDGVEVKWSDPEAETLSGFDGYRIMRRVGRQDTVFFDQVYRSDASDKAAEHTWKDTQVLFGASYFYYVQAGLRIAANDPNAHPDSRGKVVWSGRLWNPTTLEVQPPRASQSDLSLIRIAPNPYNFRDPLIFDYGWDGDRGLLFFNLPGEVNIKIFTESGDLVKTIEHNPATRAGSLRWDMLTDNQQAVASGLYIAVFEKPDGEMSYQKFLVVR